MMQDIRKPLAGLLGLALAVSAVPAAAQGDQSRRGSASALLEEITVTARKREESLQDAPLSVSALSADQVEALKIRDLTNLSVGLPNVVLEDVGTTRGVANFSIRGLGVTASIPSIDPTVGVFVDGVYMGLNNGILFDTFDLQSIEVLRGPQGILFGRNVTGGAVLLNTKKPGQEFEAKVRAAVDGGGDGGLNRYLMGSFGGPVSDIVSAKITAYWNDDEGYFKNLFDDSDHGQVTQVMLRPVVVLTPSDDVEITLRYEWQDIDGDGPSSHTFTNGNGVDGFPENFDRDSFDFSIDEPGFQNNEIQFFSGQLDWDVGENGTITNIFGWRNYDGSALSDIDAQPRWMFHGAFESNAEQISNELRYNTIIDERANLTFGLYYFKNDLKYDEARELLGVATGGVAPAQTQHGGGLYNVKTIAAFSALDYDLTDRFTLSAGVRWTREEKDAQIASLIVNVNSPCSVIAGECGYDFVSQKTWTNVSPKIGGTFELSDTARIYGHWSRGFRSGGYNLRNTAADLVNNGPGPFDEETVDNYEVGFKSDFDWGRVNGAVFFNQVQDLQADVNLPDPASAVVQIIKNTADADIMGVELDALFSVSENFVINASLGVIDSEYTEVLFDLNNDGVIDDADLALDLKRAPELTYAIGATWDIEVGSVGFLTARASYNYRDESSWNEANTAIFAEQKILNAGLDFHTMDGNWTIGVYGRNLTDEVKHGGLTILPSVLGPLPLGGSFAPLMKGRVIGLEATYSF